MMTNSAPPARDLDNIADSIRQTLGVTAGEAGTRFLSIIRNAQDTCSQCAKCGGALMADAPVWRENIAVDSPFSATLNYWVAPVCEHCKSQWRQFRPPRPCAGCGRPVRQQDDFRHRFHVTCCEVCARKAYAAAARWERTRARGTRECETCGETFQPTRTDARFCSSACRQRAYRRRKGVTDDDCLNGETINSRNADDAEVAA